jgi:hypothetical protein
MALRKNPAASFETPAPQTAAPDSPPPFDPTPAPVAAPVAPPVAPPPPPPPPPPVAPPPPPAPVAPPVAAPAPAPATAVAVAAARTQGALQVGAPKGDPKVLDKLKDYLTVDWNTLYRIKAGQGNFTGEDGAKFGTHITAVLQSWQDSWQISPGSDTEEAKTLARYSDDGVHVKGTGEQCTVYLERIKAMGYKDAAMKKRCVIVCALLDCEKDVPTIDQGHLFQLDLAPTSKGKFDQFRVQAHFDISRGALADSEATLMYLEAVPTSARGKDWTVVHFKRPKA